MERGGHIGELALQGFESRGGVTVAEYSERGVAGAVAFIEERFLVGGLIEVFLECGLECLDLGFQGLDFIGLLAGGFGIIDGCSIHRFVFWVKEVILSSAGMNPAWVK